MERIKRREIFRESVKKEMIRESRNERVRMIKREKRRCREVEKI